MAAGLSDGSKEGWALPRPAKGLRPLDTHSLRLDSKG